MIIKKVLDLLQSVSFKKMVIVILPFALILIAVSLRTYPYLTKPFWEDELYTYQFSTEVVNVWQQILRPIDDRPPLFYFWTSILTKINSSEWFLRLPGMAASILVGIVLFLAFRKYDKRFAFVAWFLSAISMFQIELSWQFRDYSYLMLITALLIYCMQFLHSKLIIGERPSARSIIGLGVVLLIGSLINHIFLPFAVSLFAAFCFVWLTIRGFSVFLFITRASLSFVAAILIGGFYLVLQFQKIHSTTFFIPYPTLLSYLVLTASFFGFSNEFSGLYYPNPFYLLQYTYINLAILAFAAVCFIVSFTRLSNKRFSFIDIWPVVVILTYVWNIALMSIASHVIGRSLFVPRAYTPLAVLLALTLAYLLVKIPQIIIKKDYVDWVIGALCSLVFLYAAYAYTSFYQVFVFFKPEPSPTAQMLQVTLSRYRSGDQLVIVPFHFQSSFIKYYWRNVGMKNYDVLQSVLLEKDTQRQRALLAFVPETYNIFFIVFTNKMKEENAHYASEYKMFAKEIFNKIKTLCLSSENEIVSNEMHTVFVCPSSRDIAEVLTQR